MQEKIDAEEEQRRINEAEKAEEYEDRRNKYYGTDEKKSGQRRKPRIYLFNLEDLDNEEIISMVELTPTFKRSKETLKEINTKALGVTAIEPESANLDPGASISFV